MQDLFIQSLQAVGLYTESVQELIEVLFDRMIESCNDLTISDLLFSLLSLYLHRNVLVSFLDQ